MFTLGNGIPGMFETDIDTSNNNLYADELPGQVDDVEEREVDPNYDVRGLDQRSREWLHTLQRDRRAQPAPVHAPELFLNDDLIQIQIQTLAVWAWASTLVATGFLLVVVVVLRGTRSVLLVAVVLVALG